MRRSRVAEFDEEWIIGRLVISLLRRGAARDGRWVGVCAIPGLRIETWGTQFCGELKETGWGSWYPTLAAKTEARQGWGTQFCGELKKTGWGSCYPRSTNARDRHHTDQDVSVGDPAPGHAA
jgi:hypothetical protein